MTPRRLILAGLVALAASGCVNVLPKAGPASPRFTLTPIEAVAPGSPVAWSLIVEDPQATRVYDNTKVALAREPGRIEFFADAEWADRAPRLVQTALIRSFENSGRILGVGDRTSLPVGDFALQTDIRAMEARLGPDGARAEVSIYARIVTSRGKVIAGRLFSSRRNVSGDLGPAAARALDEAVGAALADLLPWTFEQAEIASRK
jgi:cholesterol transport system auxiliary component